jgi:hypothetical protein
VDSNNATFYGLINNFFELNGEIITIVNILEDESDDYNFNNLSRLTFKHLKKFVKKVKLSSTFVLVKSKFIIRRAYLIETESDIFISTTVDLNEHD